MLLILDTHAFLWFVDGAPELPTYARALIEDPANDVQVSIASFWEMAIKASIGKLPLTAGLTALEAIAVTQAIDILPITLQAITRVQQLPFHHRDPFDRIIAATALTSGGVLLSTDEIFDAYGIVRIWRRAA